MICVYIMIYVLVYIGFLNNSNILWLYKVIEKIGWVYLK